MISSDTIKLAWLLIHAGIKVNPLEKYPESDYSARQGCVNCDDLHILEF